MSPVIKTLKLDSFKNTSINLHATLRDEAKKFLNAKKTQSLLLFFTIKKNYTCKLKSLYLHSIK